MSEAIHNSEVELVEVTLLLVLHVLRREKTYHLAPEKCKVDPLSKDEHNLTDGSEDMPIQSSGSVSTTLVDFLATQNFVDDSVVIAPNTPDLSKISRLSTPPSRDHNQLHSPSSIEESNCTPNFHVNPMKQVANQNFPKLSSIDEAIWEMMICCNSHASDPYYAVVDTATLLTVVKTESSSPNPP